jgi:uncharacterized protein YkwD
MMAALATASAAGAATGEADAYAARLGRLINDHRAQHGLQPLAPVASLAELAREHATYMAREHRLSHDGFQQRFANARSPTCVENVGSSPGTPEAELEAWRNSPTHARNLLDPRITRMGIAIEAGYVAFFACR